MVDTEGLTTREQEQRRQWEFEASEARANNAAERVKQIIRDRFLGFVPADFDELQQFAIFSRVAGAAVLKEAQKYSARSSANETAVSSFASFVFSQTDYRKLY